MSQGKPDQVEAFKEEHQEALRSIRLSRILLPMLIGVGAVLYLLLRKFNWKEFNKIEWTEQTFIWLGISVLLFAAWHLMYSVRLYVLADGEFSWLKCIELIFIWEFASAVSPSSVGGSAVALFIIAQEKLPVAKTTTIVLYSIVLDGFFFLATLPFLFAIHGTEIMRPGADDLVDAGGWGLYFVIAYFLMASYTLFFYYGMFINPRQPKRILAFFTKIKWLRRYRRKAIQLGNDMIVASQELKQKGWHFHFLAGASTLVIWMLRFVILSAIIIAFVDSVPRDFWTQFELYARLETMFLIFVFSPTPGGAGLIELLFGGFLSDYITSPTVATVVSTFWRVLTYYFYLLAGVIIIPNWIRKILNERRKMRMQKQQAKKE